MREPKLLREIALAVVEASPRPVTAKIRLGCTRQTINAIEVAQAIEAAGGAAVTVHGRAVIGLVPGDHTATSPRDLGQIVWPVVKTAMSQETERVLRNLARAATADRAVRGLEAVAARVQKGSRGILLVEEDYHVRGGLDRTGRSPVVTSMVDVRDALDDAVDAVIEKALAAEPP